MKIAIVVGTRPELIKTYSLIKELERKKSDFFIIHTNQHYDEKMDKVFFDELGLPVPKYNLHIGSSPQCKQVGDMLINLGALLEFDRPDVVFVQGDTNSALAGAFSASRLDIKVAHIEAGLRSYDREMPEEVNRVIIDHISDYLFCPTEKQKKILIREGICHDRIFVTGNTIVDAVMKCSDRAENRSDILQKLNLSMDKFFLLTCHRPSNTDDIKKFKEIIKGISFICWREKVKCVFPVHPRLKDKIEFVRNNSNFIVVDPVGYLDMLCMQRYAKMVFTDSGGIQEESCILRSKCIILRINTERPETLKVGGAKMLREISSDEINHQYTLLRDKKVKWSNPFGDGLAYKKIINNIKKLI